MKTFFIHFIISILICDQCIGYTTNNNEITLDNKFIYHIEKQEIDSIIQKISENDRECLDKLFKDLITSQLVGYTI